AATGTELGRNRAGPETLMIRSDQQVKRFAGVVHFRHHLLSPALVASEFLRPVVPGGEHADRGLVRQGFSRGGGRLGAETEQDPRPIGGAERVSRHRAWWRDP